MQTSGHSSGVKLAQPPGLFLLFVVEMWERFSYYGMRALLVLYLIAGAYAVKLPDGSSAEFATGSEVEVTTSEGVEKGQVTRIYDDAASGEKVQTLMMKVATPEGGTSNRMIPVGGIRGMKVDTRGNPGPGWNKESASSLYGWYTGLAYLLPIVGGLIADRFIGTHRSMIVGGLLIALGHITLAAAGISGNDAALSSQSIFITGLALIVIGTGHFKPCVSVMVGQLYGPDDPRRDGGFTIFYMGINIGAFICAFVCGTLGEQVGWHWGFGSAAVGMLLGLAIYLKFRDRYLQGIGLPPAGRGHESGWFLAGGVVLAALVGLLFHGGFFGALKSGVESVLADPLGRWAVPAAVALAVALMIGWLLSMQAPGDRGTVASILAFIGFNTVFWIAFEQAGSSLNLFAEDNTNRVLLGWEVPTSWFQSINAACVILFAPLFAGMWSGLGRKGRDPKQATKIGLALMLIAASYMFMVLGAREASTGVRVGMFWLVATYVVQTFGELCISPTGLGWVTKAAPVRFMSLLMGIWFLSSFLAGVIGGELAAITESIEQGKLGLPWYGIGRIGGQADYYLLFVIASGALGLIALASSGFFARVLRDKA